MTIASKVKMRMNQLSDYYRWSSYPAYINQSKVAEWLAILATPK